MLSGFYLYTYLKGMIKIRGFYLLKKPVNITLNDIINAVQGGFEANRCILDSELCKRAGTCVIRKNMVTLQQTVIEYLNANTLEDLLQQNL